MIAAALLVLAAQTAGPPAAPAVADAPANAALEKCRALDREFDTKKMPKPCQAAADDKTLAIPERVEALRRLAFAHILNGDAALAEPAFLQMLVFSPDTELPADAGPRFREVFANVQRRFAEEGKLAVTFTPPVVEDGPVELQVDVADPLGRVVGARVRSTVASPASGGAAAAAVPLEDRLVKNQLSPGHVRFTGRVPEPRPAPAEGYTAAYEVILEGWDGAPVAAPAPLTGEVARERGAVAASGEEPPWAIIGATTGAVVVVAGAATAGIAWCFVAGPCRQQEAWVRVQIQPGVDE